MPSVNSPQEKRRGKCSVHCLITGHNAQGIVPEAKSISSVYEIRNFCVAAVYGKWFGSFCVLPQKTFCVFRALPGMKLQDVWTREKGVAGLNKSTIYVQLIGQFQAWLGLHRKRFLRRVWLSFSHTPDEEEAVNASEPMLGLTTPVQHKLQACAHSGKPSTGARTLNPRQVWQT